MGQLNGKASFVEATLPFLNASEKDVNSLWESFNDVAEGFGINKMEMTDICISLKDAFGISTKSSAQQQMDQIVSDLFDALDTDENGLVDALEFLATIALLSSMTISEKIIFVFNCYDFDESGKITIDELTLSMKSTLTGLCKLSIGTNCPSEPALEEISMKAFHSAEKDVEDQIGLHEFIAFCDKTPEVESWINFYDAPDSNQEIYDIVDSDIENEGNFDDYSDLNAIMVDPDEPCGLRMKLKSKEEVNVVTPWMNTVSNAVPTNTPAIDDTAPIAHLHLDWIYGYNNDYRNTVRYVDSGEIIFPAAAVTVLYNIQDHKQRFYCGHVDQILCLDIHDNDYIVASGERGKSPRICVWSSVTLKTICTIRGFHQKGVCQLSWAPDNRTLVSIGLDYMHKIAIYQWASAEIDNWDLPNLLFAGDTSPKKALACHWITNSTLVTCGVSHIFFWYKDLERGDSFSKKQGCFGKKMKPQTLISLASHNKRGRKGNSHKNEDKIVFTGTINGEIGIWEGRNCIKVLRAHSSSINSLFSFQAGLISGGKDGKLRIWSKNMEPGAQFDIQALGSSRSSIRSICTNREGTKFLIGTAGCEIFEIASSDGCNLHFGPILSGHYKGNLHGLSMDPSKPNFCTVGDDESIRIWDLSAHRLLRSAELDTPARTCCYSHDGQVIGVGFGSGSETSESKSSRKKIKISKKDGGFVILNNDNLIVKYEGRDSKNWIRQLKFSSDGLSLAIASNDNCIYLYNAEDFASKGKCKAQKPESTKVAHIDFSVDGQWLQSNCDVNYEIYYFNSNTGVEEKKANALKDMNWESWTCPYGWPVQGMWPHKDCYGIYITAVDRSHKNPDLIVSGDNYGHIRLYRYPCINRGSSYNEVFGHLPKVSNIRIDPTDSYVVSTGHEDRCIFQWRLERETFEVPGEYEYHITSDDELDFADGTLLDRSLPHELAVSIGTAVVPLDSNELGDVETINGGSATDKAVRAWEASCVSPTDINEDDIDHSIPEPNLQLEWIHGYSSSGNRNNIRYLKSAISSGSRFIYPAGTVGVVFDKNSWIQKHFCLHLDDITSVAVHPNGILVATGQIGRFPKICVWNSQTIELISEISGFHERSVCELSFSPDGKILASVGQDSFHSIAFYDWKNRILIATSSSNIKNKILSIGFPPSFDVTNSANAVQFVSAGVDHIKFWQLEGHQLVGQQGLLGKKGLSQPFWSIAFVQNNTIVGTTNGELYEFKGKDLQRNIAAHVRAVTAMFTCPNVGICSGGKDGYVKLWSLELECMAEFNMEEHHPRSSKIRSVDWDNVNNRILVGTRGSEIYEISSVDGSIIDGSQPITESHWSGDVYGLAVNPVRDVYCTCGDDGTLRTWDLLSRKLIKKFELSGISRAVSYSYDGLYIAVGIGSGDEKLNKKLIGSSGKKLKKDGTILIFKSESLELVHEARDSKQYITCLKYSHDGATLVAGSYDNSVYIYDVNNDYTKRAMFSKHKSFITNIDISSDGQYLRSNCGGFELLFADIITGSHIASATALRNQTWHTTSCIYNWEVQGVWPDSSTSISINAVARSIDGKSLVAADCFGSIKLKRYPCVRNDGGFKSFRGHSINIRNIQFSQNGSHLLSVGGQDRCIFQWQYLQDEKVDEAQQANLLEEDSDLELESFGKGIFSDQEDSAQFSGIKPYLSSIIPPSNPENFLGPQNESPVLSINTIQPSLEYVYGYRAQDVRNNVVYSSFGQRIIYSAGGIGISYDRKIHHQQFYTGHNVGVEINAMAISYDGRFVASGDSGDKNSKSGSIHIWEAMSCTCVKIFEHIHSQSVKYISFSNKYSKQDSPEISLNRQRLVSIGADATNSMCVLESPTGEWNDATKIAFGQNTEKKVLFVAFINDKDYFDFISGGIDHAIFWKIESPNLVPLRGIFGSMARIQPVTCGLSINHVVVTGTAGGHLYVWENRTVSRSIHGHGGTVNAMTKTRDNSGFVTGGKDGHVKLWSKNVSPLADFDLYEAKPASFCPVIRSVFWEAGEHRIVVGTKASEIYEISQSSGDTILLLEGHCVDKLFGCVAHPTKPHIFASAGDDGTLRLWNIARHVLEGKAILDAPAKSICFSPDGNLIALGYGRASKQASSSSISRTLLKKDGAFVIVDVETLEIIHEGRESKHCISDIAFSPDGTILAIGSYDNIVYLHSALDNYSLRAKCDKSVGHITHMDFSADGNYLRVNTDAFELLFVNTMDGSWESSPSLLKDVKWSSNNCVLTWATQGILPNTVEDGYVHCVDTAGNNPIVACGEDNGKIKFYEYPCIHRDSHHVVGKGHSKLISNVQFNSNHTSLISSGGDDRCILQWNFSRLD